VSAPVVVIMAAGEGTRMRSSTPKLLHPVCGRPMIAWPVAAALEAGAERVVVVDNPARRLEEALGDALHDGRVVLAIQEQARGTADAVKAASPSFDGAETVVVLNGDVPLLRGETVRALAAAHERAGASATIATVVLDDATGYGRVVRGPNGSVQRIVETKAPGDGTEEERSIREVNAGVYAFDARRLAETLEQVKDDNAQGEFYLPDVVTILAGEGRPIAAHELQDDGELTNVNDRVALAAVRALAQRRIHERHMRAGVTVVDPASTVIDVDVEIAQDAVIAPFTSLLGATRVGAGARVGPLTTLMSSHVGEAAQVVHSYADGAEIGDRVSVGPFCYLRPGAILREGAKAGTFVEIKNSDIGPAAKVPHLSYIGDSDIGEATNIGAGTITANYDGTRKSRTSIGARAFVGVDTMFVAPVSVGDRAYTAAGSVITEDVPAGDLGIARARQRNVEGYAERRRQRAEAQRGTEPEKPPRA
jgi:bifunctional UDP-N-acetylglucosamine pyrophosphorylase/glucosamine-1-phosphate N-acetyltransferase